LIVCRFQPGGRLRHDSRRRFRFVWGFLPARSVREARHFTSADAPAEVPENHIFPPRSLSEFPITEIELRLIAALAQIGVKTPSAASGIANTL